MGVTRYWEKVERFDKFIDRLSGMFLFDDFYLNESTEDGKEIIYLVVGKRYSVKHKCSFKERMARGMSSNRGLMRIA